jgi:hypothetical protein
MMNNFYTAETLHRQREERIRRPEARHTGERGR